MLLELAPGLRVVRRGHRHLQVGLYGGRRVVLARTPTTEAVLTRILERQPLDPHQPGVAEAVSRLVASGCATAVDVVRQTARQRAASRVAVVGRLGADPTTLLESAGLVSHDADPLASDVVLVLSRVELERERLDPFVRSEIPHLVVRTADGGLLVGPFVEPGRTACLRCLDAHLGVRDPDHLPVLSRYIEASHTPRGDGLPDDADPVLVQLALAWAVRDLTAHLAGERPSTWSATVHLGPELGRQEQTSWSRHPECGCSWPGTVDQSGKMSR